MLNVDAVHQLSGAAVLGDWQVQDIDQASFGFLSLITTHDVCGKHYIRLHRETPSAASSSSSSLASASRTSPVSTILLTTPDKFAFEELSYSIETALKRLAVLSERSEAVAGAGCMEIHLAALLHRKAELLRPLATGKSVAPPQEIRGLRQLHQVVQAFADCLLKVVTSLGACPTKSAGERLLEKLESANHLEASDKAEAVGPGEAIELFGWSPLERRAVPVVSYLISMEIDDEEPQEKLVLQAHVLDSYPAKRDALVLAVECACSIARIASVVKIS